MPVSKETFTSDNWTSTQKKLASNYVSGQNILITIEDDKFKKNELVTVDKIIIDKHNKQRVLLQDGRNLIISKYKNFEVGQLKNLEICKGEKIMTRMPSKNIANGDTFTVKKTDSDGNIITEEGVLIGSAEIFAYHAALLYILVFNNDQSSFHFLL